MYNLFFKVVAISIISWFGFVGVGVADIKALENKILKDPTEPKMAVDAAKPIINQMKDFHLSAIFISESERHAVINDKVVKQGDLIGSKVVHAIDPYTVTLMDNGKESVLYLLGSETLVKGQPK